MKNTKTVILTAVLTTLATNVLLSSWLFWAALFIGAWLYLGYLGNVMYGDKIDNFIVLGPFIVLVASIERGTRGFKNLWDYFFTKPFPKFRSPFVFDKSEE